MTVLPDDDRTIDDLLTSARTRNRYATYDMAAAEARLRARQTARHANAPPTPPPFTPNGPPPRTNAPRTPTAPGGT
ncbi:hypothetical protein ABZ299_19130 [Streptomyces sp. NPDC006184]|uniref:hypothetical protein n=1 Tax=Streptomyces sp. NPDC006184 TaxID=3155455 RepID=UPI0033A85852